MSLHQSFTQTLSSYSNLTLLRLDLANQLCPNTTLPGIPTNSKHHAISTHHKVPNESHDSFHPDLCHLYFLSNLQYKTTSQWLFHVLVMGQGQWLVCFPKNLQAYSHTSLMTTNPLSHPQLQPHCETPVTEWVSLEWLEFEYHCPFVGACFQWAKDDSRECTESPPDTISQPIAKHQEGTPPCWSSLGWPSKWGGKWRCWGQTEGWVGCTWGWTLWGTACCGMHIYGEDGWMWSLYMGR
jgi:hypothetical protein